MEIIILGCGKVGTALVERLSEEKHSITVIDNRPEKINAVTEAYDVMGIVGNGSSITTLNEAGIETADVFISVTGSDEINLLCCMFAKKQGHCRAIARVRNPSYNQELDFIQQQLGITTIVNPELATANEIFQLLMFPSASAIDDFADGRVRLVKFELPSGTPLHDLHLKDISKVIDADILICCVERDGEAKIPNGNFVIKNGDSISFLATPDSAKKFFEKLNLPVRPARNCIIVGGGTIGYYLAKSLIEKNVKVRMVDNNIQRCEELSVLLPEATIINGDGTDRELLIQEGLTLTDAFVSLTNLDEENILLGLFAKKRSDAKVVSKVNKLEFDDILAGLDVGSTVFPKYITCDFIMQYVRALQQNAGSELKTMYRILNDKVEALEFSITEKARYTGIPLAKLKLKPNQLIACITRGNSVILPRGNDEIKVGDSVILISLERGMDDFSDALE